MKNKVTEKNATHRISLSERDLGTRTVRGVESYHMSAAAAYRATRKTDGISYPTRSPLHRDIEVRAGDGWREMTEIEHNQMMDDAFAATR